MGNLKLSDFLFETENLHLLLIVSNPKTIKHIICIAHSAKNRGHKVTIFFNERSVKLLRDQRLEGVGDNLLACISSSKRAGITSSDFIDGARMSSLGEMVEFLGNCDKVLFLG